MDSEEQALSRMLHSVWQDEQLAATAWARTELWLQWDM